MRVKRTSKLLCCHQGSVLSLFAFLQPIHQRGLIKKGYRVFQHSLFPGMSVPDCPSATTSCQPSLKQRPSLSNSFSAPPLSLALYKPENWAWNATHIYEIIYCLVFHFHVRRRTFFILSEWKHVKRTTFLCSCCPQISKGTLIHVDLVLN